MKIAIVTAAAFLVLVSEGCTHQYAATIEPRQDQYLATARTIYIAQSEVAGRWRPRIALTSAMEHMAVPLRVVATVREADLVLHYFDFQGICYHACPYPPRRAWMAVLSTPNGKLVA